MMTDTDQKDGQGKVCTKCGEWKLLSEYHAAKLGKLGRSATCKVCKKIWSDANYAANKEKINAWSVQWQKNNPDRVRELNRENKRKNREKILAKLKDAYWADPDAARMKLREARKANPERTKEQNKRSNRKRYEDPKFRVENAIRSGIWAEISRSTKRSRRTFDLLGYTPEELMRHLENQFTEGMTFENYGEWHVDHIIPLSVFNYTTPDDLDFKRAWSLSNLRPLWAEENMQKGSKLYAPFQPSLALSVPPAANDNQPPPKRRRA